MSVTLSTKENYLFKGNDIDCEKFSNVAMSIKCSSWFGIYFQMAYYLHPETNINVLDKIEILKWLQKITLNNI